MIPWAGVGEAVGAGVVIELGAVVGCERVLPPPTPGRRHHDECKKIKGWGHEGADVGHSRHRASR